MHAVVFWKVVVGIKILKWSTHALKKGKRKSEVWSLVILWIKKPLCFPLLCSVMSLFRILCVWQFFLKHFVSQGWRGAAVSSIYSFRFFIRVNWGENGCCLAKPQVVLTNMLKLHVNFCCLKVKDNHCLW